MIFTCILNIREGKIINKHSFNAEKKVEEDDIFERVFTMYYDEREMPKHIILDKKYFEKAEMLKEWIKIKEKSLSEIHFPMINSRRMELLEMAYINLNDDIKKTLFKERVVEHGIIELKESLNLKEYPLRIECLIYRIYKEKMQLVTIS